MKKMSKEELLKLVKIISNAGLDEDTGKKYSEKEIDRLVEVFEENISHPGGADLIFYPELCGLSNDVSPEEIVCVALNYKEENK